MSGSRPVLVLDADPGFAATVSAALAAEGWRTKVVATPDEARVSLRRDDPCIAVLDLSLPNTAALVREAAGRPGLCVIAVGDSVEMDRVLGPECGADDFLAKPLPPGEVVAHVRALSRRLDAALRPAKDAPPRTAAWSLGGLRMEPARRRVVATDGTETRLTGGEAGFLAVLLDSEDHLAARETISERVLGRRLLPNQRGVDQIASNLRQKLGAASAGHVTVVAVSGRGYRLVW
ncbi:DNA-binding response regulator [Roseomonas sp. KE2513]|uniref:response regulator transcription factor n=1 Tax=Roseomonas sp. KE2513 TaxID=2479202 RepID=UPI0018DF2DCE|nr:response regulator transcription factor [Roseomonas sp. KE2513]MBI0534660.1 DNA-binding response regulator [Roseomonas sp. KE2513]